MWIDLLSAIALVFILEGIFPFVNPPWTRRVFHAAAKLGDTTLRLIGACSMFIGLALLYLVR